MGTISFDYLPDSPLSHRWELAKKDARFETSASKDHADALTIKAEDAIDYAVEKYQRVCNRVRFSAKLSDRSYVYVKIQFRAPGRTNGPDWGWIACDTGVGGPRKESRDEWVISRIPEKNGWTHFDLFLPEEVQQTYGQVEVLQFKELLGFRLRGELSISPISLFRDDIEGEEAMPDPMSRSGAASIHSEAGDIAQVHETKRWSRADKLTAVGVVATILGLLIAVFFPEIRRFFHLDRPSVSQSSSPSNLSAPEQPVRKPLQIVTAKDGPELRQLNQVAPIREAESGKTLSEIPPGSFGFVQDEELVARELSLHPDIDVNSSELPNEFEIHKLRDGSALLAVYVGPETLDRLREGLQPNASISLYTTSWNEAPILVAVPLNQINCTRNRELSAEDGRKRKYVSVLDCRQK